MSQLPTRFLELAKAIVNRVRSAPPDVSDEALYGDVGRQLSAFMQRIPSASEGQFLRGCMKDVLLTLYHAKRPLYADELRERIKGATGKEPGYISVNHALRKGEARLLIDRMTAPHEGRSATVANTLTAAGRRYVEELLEGDG